MGVLRCTAIKEMIADRGFDAASMVVTVRRGVPLAHAGIYSRLGTSYRYSWSGVEELSSGNCSEPTLETHFDGPQCEAAPLGAPYLSRPAHYYFRAVRRARVITTERFPSRAQHLTAPPVAAPRESRTDLPERAPKNKKTPTEIKNSWKIGRFGCNSRQRLFCSGFRVQLSVLSSASPDGGGDRHPV